MLVIFRSCAKSLTLVILANFFLVSFISLLIFILNCKTLRHSSRTTGKSPFREQKLSRMKSQMRFSQRGAESVQTSIKETHTHLFHVQHEVCVCLFARGARARPPTRRGLVLHTHAHTQAQCLHTHRVVTTVIEPP